MHRAGTSRGWLPLLLGISALLIGAASGRAAPEALSEEPPPPRFPPTLTTISGQTLDLRELSERKTLIVVTLKATGCPVCQRQLLRIKARLPELEPCGVSFLVLSPGPREEIARIRERTGFPYPFVEDKDLAIAQSFGLKLGADQILPAILMLNPDLSLGWIQRGRSERYFGDAALVEKVACWNSI